ncbi:MAG TPA: TMEM165/GDT1 family protein [Burkholderiales bacterium]|nr:TMEM165/GDT1 family protein [Burkholderiales bacterium]
MEALLTSIVLVAVAEIGDKTQLLSFVLAARLRKPWPIIGGIFLATVANHTLAGWVGSLLAGWVPPATLAWIVGFSFIAFGLWALHPDSLDGSPRLHKAGAFVTAFVAFFLAEMGDKTQFATVALAARFDSLGLVVIGTTIGMMLANVPAVWIGEKLALKIPLKAVRLVAAALFMAVGALTLWSASAPLQS